MSERCGQALSWRSVLIFGSRWSRRRFDCGEPWNRAGLALVGGSLLNRVPGMTKKHSGYVATNDPPVIAAPPQTVPISAPGTSK